MANKESSNERQMYNLKILEVLKSYVLSYPDLRFNQIINNLNITEVDDLSFYRESKETYNDILEATKKIEVEKKKYESRTKRK